MEAVRQQLSKDAFASVSEWCMSKIVSKSDRFGKVFIQSQSPSHGPGNLADFQGVGETCTIMVSLWRKKNLGFIFQASESLAMQNAITIDLKDRANRAGIFSNPSTL
jgi:hypothetical protein